LLHIVAQLAPSEVRRVLRGLMCLQHALRSYSLVFDAVYTPKITRLLREAEESGATIVSGLEMFIGQAYEQFERFAGLSGELSSYYTLYIFTACPHNILCTFLVHSDLFKSAVSLCSPRRTL